MASISSEPEIVLDLPNFIRVYKDGRVERLIGTDVVAPSIDPDAGIQSKDVVIDPETAVSARLFLPKTADPNQKLPLLIYFHGGGFCVESAFSPEYHNYLNSLVAEANVVAVSVDYRRAPEHPLPAAYGDSWAAVKWVASHSACGGNGNDEWLKTCVDFDRVFFGGDSAGANIAHHMAIRVGSEGLSGVNLAGIFLIHPYFGGMEPIGSERDDIKGKAFADKLWKFAFPSSSGSDDPLFNPEMDPRLSGLGCKKVLVCVAEKDLLRDRGWRYKEKLEKSGWGGTAEVVEAAEESHVFHLFKPTCDNAVTMLKRVVAFLN
ncbi:hypothetical protein U1Q18_034985 [Sarracenia purpurea var. burkii]